MIKLVESKEAEKAFYHWFTYVDPQAFKKEGFIQSYEIDRNSISKNPMRGIDFDIIINGDSDFIISCNINKNSDGEIESTSATYSDKLSQAMERQELGKVLIDDEKLNDKQHIDIALRECHIDSKTKDVVIGDEGSKMYIGTVSQIYDNIKGERE